MKSIAYLSIACAMVTCALSESRDVLLKQINSHVGDTHGYVNDDTGQSKLGDISPEALPLCFEISSDPKLSLYVRGRYTGIVANYMEFFPERISPEKRALYLDQLLGFFEANCLNNSTEIERGPCGTAFSRLSNFYDVRILELGQSWLSKNPLLGERRQVYYYEKKFRDMEKIGYSPEKWREIVKREEPPVGPLAAKLNAESARKQSWWFALLGLILLVPFTVWIKRGSKRSNDK